MSHLKFEFVAQAHLRLPSSFSNQLILLMVVWEKDYMKLDIGKVVDNMTRGSCIPIDSVNRVMIISVLFIVLGLGHILSQIISIRHIRLVHVVHSRVGVIRVK